MLLAFNKPYNVLSQFNENPGEEGKQRTLSEFNFPEGVLPLGRLDLDSEGLILLTDEKDLEHKLLHPKFGHRRRYLAQVDGEPDTSSLDRLRNGGLEIKGHRTLPCKAKLLDAEPDLPPRDPPIRYRANIPTSWIELELREGKNRQVRRMTAAVGHPTLRLARISIGRLTLKSLAITAGEWRELSAAQRKLIFQRA